MRLILVGPPGGGKGTQAKLLSERLKLTHIATGDILREAMRLGTPAGRRAEPYVKSGHLVPDELVNELVADRFRREDRPTDFVMDGYPRTVSQAETFDAALHDVGLNIGAVLFLDVPDEEIVRRLSGRWTCPKCQTPYHTLSNPPRKAGICDECGTVLVQRSDDKEETVRERLRVYRDTTVKLVPYYRQKGLLKEIAGKGGLEDIYAELVKVLRVTN